MDHGTNTAMLVEIVRLSKYRNNTIVRDCNNLCLVRKTYTYNDFRVRII